MSPIKTVTVQVCRTHTSSSFLIWRVYKNSFQVSVVLQCTLWCLRSPQNDYANGPITTAVLICLSVTSPDMFYANMRKVLVMHMHTAHGMYIANEVGREDHRVQLL